MRTTVLPKKKPPKTSPPNFSNWQAKRAYENPFVKISSNTNIFGDYIQLYTTTKK